MAFLLINVSKKGLKNIIGSVEDRSENGDSCFEYSCDCYKEIITNLSNEDFMLNLKKESKIRYYKSTKEFPNGYFKLKKCRIIKYCKYV